MYYVRLSVDEPIVNSGEATQSNCIVLGLIRSGIEPTIYRTRGGDFWLTKKSYLVVDRQTSIPK
jgi:hypothetical protein